MVPCVQCAGAKGKQVQILWDLVTVSGKRAAMREQSLARSREGCRVRRSATQETCRHVGTGEIRTTRHWSYRFPPSRQGGTCAFVVDGKGAFCFYPERADAVFYTCDLACYTNNS